MDQVQRTIAFLVLNYYFLLGVRVLDLNLVNHEVSDLFDFCVWLDQLGFVETGI